MKKIDFSGEWKYRLDPENRGDADQWFLEQFDEMAVFTVPGTTATNDIGTELVWDYGESLKKSDVERFREKFSYRGKLWLQRDFFLSEEEKNDKYKGLLEFERILGRSAVWLNGEKVGSFDSLSVPHRYDVPGSFFKWGQSNTVTVLLDNQNHHHLGELASGYTDQTQTFWCGIVGFCRMTLFQRFLPQVLIQNDFEQQRIEVRLTLAAGSNEAQTFHISFGKKNGEIFESQAVTFSAAETIKKIFFVIEKKLELWNEFQQPLYEVILSDTERMKRYSLGWHQLKKQDQVLLFNDQKLFLRGTLDCCIFPDTGYPPADGVLWKKNFTAIKSYGLNHIRFHSWCPPEAAFKAADELGLYLMVEGPFWLDEWFHNAVGDFSEHYAYIASELEKIVFEYGHHPSFCFFAVGNELAGDFEALAQILRRLPVGVQEILTTITSNTTNRKRTFYPGADDFFVGVEYQARGLRGNRFLDQMVDSTTLNYDYAMEILELPTVTHEIGQYSVYPNMAEIKKYQGVLSPVNFMGVEKDLDRKNLLAKAGHYLTASAKLSADLYKAEVEAAVRTKNLSGYQLLGLQDFPGQSTAIVGMLDSFWESKGILSKEWFAQFLAPVVPMIEMDRRFFSLDEQTVFRWFIRNGRMGDFEQGKFEFLLKEKDTIVEQQIFTAPVCQGEYQQVHSIAIDFSQLSLSKNQNHCLTCQLSVKLGADLYQNQWQIWLYAAKPPLALSPIIFQDHELSQEMIEALDKGQTCLLTPKPTHVKDVQRGEFFPVFWSPVFFESIGPCGMFIKDQHPLFKNFPTQEYASFQWKKLLESSITFPVPEIEAITTVVPNYYHNGRYSNLFEARVGKGKLFVCGFDLARTNSLEEQAFKNVLFDYLLSPDFDPVQNVSLTALSDIFSNQAAAQGSVEQRNDWAYKKKAWADNEKSNLMGAAKGNDGNPMSCWSATDQSLEHWWCVDLGREVKISEIVIRPLNHEVMELTVEVSSDGKTWQSYAKSMEKKVLHQFQNKRTGRYVRVSYDHPINKNAGQYSCQVFGTI